MKNKILIEGIKDWIEEQIEDALNINELLIKKDDEKINIMDFLNDIENQTDKGIDYEILFNEGCCYLIHQGKEYKKYFYRKNDRLSEIANVLVNWVDAMSVKERNEIIYADCYGQYSYNDEMMEIENQTIRGVRIEKNIIGLFLDLLYRTKKNLIKKWNITN